MFCSISGEVLQEPVVSKKSGYIYEKRLIEKYLKEDGKCPISGHELVESDLLPIKSNVPIKPRPSTSAGVPAMLAMFQNEWDEHVLEMFTLKQNLETTRQELSQALYQHDAACRVIAKLIRERDEARAMLAAIPGSHTTNAGVTNGPTSTVPTSVSTEAMDVDSSSTKTTGDGLNATVISAINAMCAELSGSRRGRKAPEGLTSREALSQFAVLSSSSPHRSDKPGVTCLAVATVEADSNGSAKKTHVLTGGVDKDIILSDYTTGVVLGKAQGHSKKVTAVAFHPHWPAQSTIVSASSDKSVKVWRGTENESDKMTFAEVVTFYSHTDEVLDVSVHPTGDYAMSVSHDGGWAFVDLHHGSTLCTVRPPDTKLLCGKFHPDGLILATGTSDNQLKIWDVREQTNVANCVEHTGPVSCLSFSENGYLLVSGSHDGTVRVWDLRKLKCTKTIQVGDAQKAVNAVSFDYSGSYVAIGGASLSIRVVKEWTEIPLPAEVANAHAKGITAVAWSDRKSSRLLSASLDRTVKVYGSAK